MDKTLIRITMILIILYNILLSGCTSTLTPLPPGNIAQTPLPSEKFTITPANPPADNLTAYWQSLLGSRWQGQVVPTAAGPANLTTPIVGVWALRVNETVGNWTSPILKIYVNGYSEGSNGADTYSGKIVQISPTTYKLIPLSNGRTYNLTLNGTENMTLVDCNREYNFTKIG